MKLQKHFNRKGKNGDYYKWEIVLSSDVVKEASFKEGDELEAEAKKGEIKLSKK
jgi:hypothetical protein